MTIKNTVKEKLINHGLWPQEADDIVENVILAPENEAMKDLWNDHAEGYPEQITSLAWFSAKLHAIEFLEKNKPMHFALNILKTV